MKYIIFLHHCRDGHIAGSPKSRKSSLWGVGKCQKSCDFLIFSKKNIFFVAQKGMLIHRFLHSLGVWGFWGGSQSIDFAIFRVLGTPNREVPAISCPHCCYFRSMVTRRKNIGILVRHFAVSLKQLRYWFLHWSNCYTKYDDRTFDFFGLETLFFRMDRFFCDFCE